MQNKFRVSLSDLLGAWLCHMGQWPLANPAWRCLSFYWSLRKTAVLGWANPLLLKEGWILSRAVLCLVALMTTAKGHRDRKRAGIHSRNLEDFFKVLKDGLTKVQREIQFCLPKSEELVPGKGSWGAVLGRKASKTCSIRRDGVVRTAALLFSVSLSQSQVHSFNNPLSQAAVCFAFVSLIKKRKNMENY